MKLNKCESHKSCSNPCPKSMPKTKSLRSPAKGYILCRQTYPT